VVSKNRKSVKVIKAIVFDIGDVILKFNWEKIYLDFSKITGINIKDKIGLDKLRRINNDLTTGNLRINAFFEELSKNKKISIIEIEEAYKKCYLKYSPINKSLINLVRKLNKNYKLYVLSNTKKLHKDLNLKRGIFDNFDRVFLSCDIKMKKPNKDIYNYVLEKINLQPQEIIFIDDLEKNILVANKLGINGILFKNNKQLIDELKNLGARW